METKYAYLECRAKVIAAALLIATTNCDQAATCDQFHAALVEKWGAAEMATAKALTVADFATIVAVCVAEVAA